MILLCLLSYVPLIRNLKTDTVHIPLSGHSGFISCQLVDKHVNFPDSLFGITSACYMVIQITTRICAQGCASLTSCPVSYLVDEPFSLEVSRFHGRNGNKLTTFLAAFGLGAFWQYHFNLSWIKVEIRDPYGTADEGSIWSAREKALRPCALGQWALDACIYFI